jgi:PAS domain S-box-containing protein
MNHNQAPDDMQNFLSLTRKINQSQANLSAEETAALEAALPDLALLLKNILNHQLPDGEVTAHLDQGGLDKELRRVLDENNRQRLFLEANSFVDPGGHTVVAGEDLIIQYANPAYRAITPHPEIDPLGQPYGRIWPVEEGYNQAAIIREAIRDQKEIHLQRHPRRMPDGSILYYTFHIHPMTWEELPAAYLFLWDTTELVQMEEALRESKKRLAAEREWFRITLSSIGDAVITTDAEARVSFLNLVAEKLTGWSLEEAVGQPMERVFNIINEQTRQPAENPVARVLREGLVVGLANHTSLIDRQGRETPIEDSAAPIKDTGGQILGVVMVFRDVTEKRKNETALQESRALLRAVIDGIPEPIFLKDCDSRILLANPATFDVIGKPAEQVIGKRDIDFYDDLAVGEAILENDRQVMASGQTQVIEERVIQSGEPPEKQRIYLSTKTPYRDYDGNVIGILGVAREITGQKQRERELNKLNRTLQALNKSNQAMLRASDQQILMQETCNIITEDCGYAMVWIGLAEHDPVKTVRPVAHAGFEAGYLDQIHLSWADTEWGRGPTGIAIRTGKPAICRDMTSDPDFALWREEALKRGYASSLVLPLIGFGSPFGAITIYSTETNAFSDEEVQLLAELAGDLGYGITTMRIRAAHAQAEQALRVSEERYRSLFEGMTEGFALHEIRCDDNGVPLDYRFLELNPAFERLTGLRQEDLRGKWKSEVEQLRGDDHRWIEIYGKVALTGEPIRFENYSPALDRHFEVFAYRPAPQQFAVIFMDITDRKQTEEALRQARETAEKNRTQIEVQRRLIEQREQERQRIAHDLHDGPVQAITGITFAIQELVMNNPGPELSNALVGIRNQLQEVIGELRTFAQELRPPILFNFGLRRAIQAHLENFQESHPNLQTQLKVEWVGDPLPEQVLIALFRVYQESLNNIVKHAQATEIQVHLARDDRQFEMDIEDNGSGFVVPKDPLYLTREGHLGLAGMRERVEAIGGSLKIDSSPGTGTRVQVKVPLA